MPHVGLPDNYAQSETYSVKYFLIIEDFDGISYIWGNRVCT